jgi:phosphoadenosine phosphosulfate reductase
MIRPQRSSAAERLRVDSQIEESSPQEVLRWAVDSFFPELALACSFSGPSGMVLVDMISRIEPRVEIFYIDTDHLFPETHETRDRAAARYGFSPVACRPSLTPAEQAGQYGGELWLRDPDLCCELRKVEPSRRALAGKRAWVSGIRRDQAVARRDAPVAGWDAKFDLVKVLPLARWTEADVWAYIVEHDVPYNPLHDRGYQSIGCDRCTKVVRPGDDPRSGRWLGFDKTECGLHSDDSPVKLVSGTKFAS